jgi:hypothetical protein
LRLHGEKLARALDQHIDREYPDRSDALLVRLAVADHFTAATVSARAPRRPFPHAAAGERSARDQPGDWN